MIRKFAARHINAVAELHRVYLTGMLRELGISAIRAFYRGAAESELAIAYVYEAEDRVLGFVLGSGQPEEFKREITRSHFVSTCLGAAAGLLRNPRLARTILEAWRYQESTFNRQTAELIYLAVDTRQRTSGIGRALVEAFGGELQATGVDAYELSVAQDNRNAMGFYERLGFRQVGQYHEFGTEHSRYRMTLGTERK